jgi:exodeoxyribonuclease VII small subunit
MPAKPSKQTTNKPDDSYQDLRQQLDRVMQQLQDPECDVDEAATLYEQALALAAALEQRLNAAEAHVKQVRVQFGLEPESGRAAD